MNAADPPILLPHLLELQCDVNLYHMKMTARVHVTLKISALHPIMRYRLASICLSPLY